MCRNCNNIFSKSKGTGLTAQENEGFLSNIVLEGRNTNGGRRVKWQKRKTKKSRSVQAVFKNTLSSQYDQEQNVLNVNSEVFQLMIVLELHYLMFKSMQNNLNKLSKPHLQLPSSQIKVRLRKKLYWLQTQDMIDCHNKNKKQQST